MVETKKDWINYMIEEAVKYYNGRKIVLWGKYSVSEEIEERLLSEYDIEIECYIDSNINKGGVNVNSTEYIKGKAQEYYIIIPIAFYESVKNMLTEYGYEKDKDYHYFCDCILEKREDYYKDSHGNEIIGNYSGVKIVFSGFDSKVKIGADADLKECAIYIHSNCYVVIGERCNAEHFTLRMSGMSRISIGNNINLGTQLNCYMRSESEIELRDNCRIISELGDRGIFAGNSSMIIFEENVNVNIKGLEVHDAGRLEIGKNTTSGYGLSIYLPRMTKVTIGKDCMFSWEITILSNDFHSIFDVKTGKNINSTKELCEARNVIIGNHVWIGMNTTLLYGTEIGDGSIIGADSVVKSKIPNNCIAVGAPARVVRTDVAWCRECGCEDISMCGEEYINLTQL